MSSSFYENKEQKKQLLLLLLIIFLDGVCGDGALGEYLGGEDGLHPPHVVRPHHQLHAQGLQGITQRGNKGEMSGISAVDQNPVYRYRTQKISAKVQSQYQPYLKLLDTHKIAFFVVHARQKS